MLNPELIRVLPPTNWPTTTFSWYTSPVTRTRPMNCLGDPIWHQKMRTNWLSSSRIICLPPRIPRLRRTWQHVPNPKITAPTQATNRTKLTIADTSLKIWQTNTSHSRLVQQTWVTTTSYRPSNSIKRLRRPKEKMPRPLGNGNEHTASRNTETSGQKRAPSLLWETTSLRGG